MPDPSGTNHAKEFKCSSSLVSVETKGLHQLEVAWTQFQVKLIDSRLVRPSCIENGNKRNFEAMHTKEHYYPKRSKVDNIKKETNDVGFSTWSSYGDTGLLLSKELSMLRGLAHRSQCHGCQNPLCQSIGNFLGKVSEHQSKILQEGYEHHQEVCRACQLWNTLRLLHSRNCSTSSCLIPRCLESKSKLL